ncbi:MAG: PH domain-containing protein [Candidatus Altiarchaeota archaeon]|nr:PH domain-containing protein [Candidatus Altiarchaeota archaeon]
MAEELVWKGGLSPLSLVWYWVIGVFTIWILGLGLIIILLGVIRMYTWRYEVTSERIRISHGFISRTTREADLEKIQDILVKQGLWGRLLNYGDICFNTAGTTSYEIVFTDVSDPDGLKEKFWAALNKRKKPSSV